MTLSSPAYSITLVNYKSREITEICLNLLHQTFKDSNVPIWVVDNNSQDDSTEYLRSLDWINLIERMPIPDEKGFMAHGCALDLVLEQITTDHLFLLHSDTLIHNPEIFDLMLDICTADQKVAVVGCLEQIDRGYLRTFWRFSSRFMSYYFRRFKLKIGLQSRPPKFYREIYLKSFCALWNTKILKQHNFNFMMNNRIPSYEAQDKLLELGYKISTLPPRKMFHYLDHVEAATVSAQGGYHKSHRRAKRYHATISDFK